MSFGKHGCINAALTALQIFALNDPELALRLAEDRAQVALDLVSDDAANRQDFHV
jgi:phosphoribosylcarboxyaminoimidazole (NCAIR) mutase